MNEMCLSDNTYDHFPGTWQRYKHRGGCDGVVRRCRNPRGVVGGIGGRWSKRWQVTYVLRARDYVTCRLTFDVFDFQQLF